MINSEVSMDVMAGRLLRYLRTWHDERGAIHGVHTHPVWRLHPGVMEDHYTGYSAWGAPYLIALADLVAKTGDAEICHIAERLVEYLLTTLMENDRWDNAGAEFGRCFNESPVDNMLQDLSLAYFAGAMRDRLRGETFTRIGECIERNLRSYIQPEAILRQEGRLIAGTVNQDLTGLWAIFEWMHVYGTHAEWERLALLALDVHLEQHRVLGVPDSDSAGMIRASCLPDYIEPAEYYGVIIPAYLWGYRRTGERRYLDAAWQMARHVFRTTWTDEQGCRRLYRNFHRINGQWRVSHSPMLISGGGLFSRAVGDLLRETPDDEARQFLADMRHTYVHYQNPYGCIAQASGWHDDFDIIVGTVWQCHDLAYFAAEVQDGQALLQAFREPAPDLAVIIGWHDCWVENASQWAILRPWSMGFGSVGLKSADYGYPAIPDWCNPKYPAMELAPSVEVRQVDDGFVIRAPEYRTISVTSIYGKPWERE